MLDPSPFDLGGRVALVTGASRGIGQAIAEALARAGADVAITARSLGALSETQERLSRTGRRVEAIVHDVATVAGCRSAVEETVARFGRVDVLVNNAGVEDVRPALEVDEDLWDRIVGTNLKGAFFCAQAAAAHMQGAGRPGAIINLCSLTSAVGVPGAVPYGSSKSGLLGMTRALAVELAPIRVNAVAPGLVKTPLWAAMSEVDRQGLYAGAAAHLPVGHAGEAAEIAESYLYLIRQSYGTGQVLVVDGGGSLV